MSATFPLVSLHFDDTRSRLASRNASTPSFALPPANALTNPPPVPSNGRGPLRLPPRKLAPLSPPTRSCRASATPPADNPAPSHSSLSSSLGDDLRPSTTSSPFHHLFSNASAHQPLQGHLTSDSHADWAQEQLADALSHAVLS